MKNAHIQRRRSRHFQPHPRLMALRSTAANHRQGLLPLPGESDFACNNTLCSRYWYGTAVVRCCKGHVCAAKTKPHGQRSSNSTYLTTQPILLGVVSCSPIKCDTKWWPGRHFAARVTKSVWQNAYVTKMRDSTNLTQPYCGKTSRLDGEKKCRALSRSQPGFYRMTGSKMENTTSLGQAVRDQKKKRHFQPRVCLFLKEALYGTAVVQRRKIFSGEQ